MQTDHLSELDLSLFSSEQIAEARQRQREIEDRRNHEWNNRHWQNRAARRSRRAG